MLLHMVDAGLRSLETASTGPFHFELSTNYASWVAYCHFSQGIQPVKYDYEYLLSIFEVVACTRRSGAGQGHPTSRGSRSTLDTTYLSAYLR